MQEQEQGPFGHFNGMTTEELVEADARQRAWTKMAAQVALEAVIDNTGAYESATIRQVLSVAEHYGVARLYLDMAEAALLARIKREAGWL